MGASASTEPGLELVPVTTIPEVVKTGSTPLLDQGSGVAAAPSAASIPLVSDHFSVPTATSQIPKPATERMKRNWFPQGMGPPAAPMPACGYSRCKTQCKHWHVLQHFIPYREMEGESGVYKNKIVDLNGPDGEEVQWTGHNSESGNCPLQTDFRTGTNTFGQLCFDHCGITRGWSFRSNERKEFLRMVIRRVYTEVS